MKGLLLLALAQQPDELARLSQQGKTLMMEQRFADAVPVYERLAKAMPGNAGLLSNLGMALHLSGEYKRSLGPLEQALKIAPRTPGALFYLGASYLRLGETAKAIVPLGTLEASFPGNPAALGMLADAKFLVGRFEESAAHFRKLAAVDPENPKSWLGLGRAYEALADRSAGELAKTGPGSGYWFALVAESRSRQSQRRSAFYFYRKALELTPGLRGAHAALAAIYRESGKPDWASAEDAAEKALGAPECSAPTLECHFRTGRDETLVRAARLLKTPESFYWRARAYSRLAAAAFDRVGRLPESVESWALMAELHQGQGRFVEAAKAWEAALRLEPADDGIKQDLAAALHQAKDDERARKITEELLAKAPASPELNFLMGEICLAQQQPEPAITHLMKASQADPGALPVRAALARALLAAGHATDAIPHLEAALSMDEDGSLHFQLVRAFQTAGDTAKAKAAMARYQELRGKLAADRQVLEDEVKITAPPGQ